MDGDARQRVRETLDHLFPERQFYYRSEGVVRFVTLGKTAQIAVCCTALALVGWMLFTSAEVLLRNQIIDAKNTRIREVTLAYDALAQRSYDAQRQILTITGQIESQHQQLVDLVAYRTRLEGQLGELHGALDTATGLRDTAQARTNELQRQVASLQTEMTAAATANRALTQALAAADALGRNAIKERDIAQAAHTAVTRQLDDATGARLAAAEAERRAEAALADARGQLALATRERDDALARNTDLGKQVADLNARVNKATDHTTEMLANLAKAEDQAIAMGVQREEAMRSRDFMAKLADELQFRLTDVKASQGELVARLNDRATAGVNQVEAVIKETGLDLEQLLANADPDGGPAIGGPLVPIAFANFAGRQVAALDMGADPFYEAVANTEQQLDRWATLQHALSRIPLIAPIDEFSVSSAFGARKDPFTGQAAFHEGIDLAAPIKTQIRAPAPGRVTRVGYWGSYGLMVEIDHGFGMVTRYGHLLSTPLKRGQQVTFRQDVGLVGSSGRSTGSHVHYEVLFNGNLQDPAKFVKAGRYVYKNGD